MFVLFKKGKMLRYVLDLVSQGILDVSIASTVGQWTQVVKTDTMHTYVKASHITKSNKGLVLAMRCRNMLVAALF